MTESEIVERLQKNDEAALRFLISQWGDRLLRSAFLILGDYQSAEDALQETYLTVVRKISRFKGDSSLYTWVYKIMVNKCRNFLRKKRPLLLTDDVKGTEYTFGGQYVVDFGLKDATISTAVHSLPLKYREVVVLHYFLDMPLKEVAKATRSRLGTVKSRLKRSRDLLRDYLKVETDTLAEGDSHGEQVIG